MPNLLKNILFLAFIASGAFCLAQDNNSKLTIQAQSIRPSNNHKYSYSLYRGDTLISITPVDNISRFKKTHLLTCGIYNLQIFRNDSLCQTHLNIDVECGYEKIFQIYLEQNIASEINPDIFTPDPSPVTGKRGNIFEVYESFGYGRKTFEGNEMIARRLIYFAIGGTNLYVMNKHIALGYQFEYNYTWANPERDTTFLLPGNYWKERYSLLAMTMAPVLRIATYNLNYERNKGMFFDLGVKYFLPFMFRHVAIYSNHKDITRGIHQFNHLNAFFRVGGKHVGFTLEYRMFDFIKPHFSQVPKFNLGLTILIET